MPLSDLPSGPYEGVKAASLLAYWPFIGTYDDVSSNANGPAVVQGNGVNLALLEGQDSGYAQVRRPGFLKIPAVDLRTISFSIELTMRFPRRPSTTQRVLSNWKADNWQYFMTIDPDGILSFTLQPFPHTSLGPSEPSRGLVLSGVEVPMGMFFTVIYQYDRTRGRFYTFVKGTTMMSHLPREVPRADLTPLGATQQYGR